MNGLSAQPYRRKRKEHPRLPDDFQFGTYTVQGLIGKGGMGQVYVATDSIYGNTVALKVLHPELHADDGWRTRFNEEGLVGTRLKHPHVLSARELVENEGRIALVLDLIKGGQTVEKIVNRDFRNGVPLTIALDLFLKILQGIDYLHEKGIVHGDIKPENVMIRGNAREPETWVPLVTDFGTVALIANPVEIEGKPAVVATPRYASPEHLLGVDRIEVRSDVYCLGLILHFLVTGKHVSDAKNIQEAVSRVMNDVPIDAMADHPASLIEVFERATARSPLRRYANVRELALAIRDVLEELGVQLGLEDVQAELATEVDDETDGSGDAAVVSPDLSAPTPSSSLRGAVRPIAPELETVEPVKRDATPARPISAAAQGQPEREAVPLAVWVAGSVAALLIVVIAVYSWAG
ncbi:MAG: serine/threonine-protein kinase [Myxococcota bacterium]